MALAERRPFDHAIARFHDALRRAPDTMERRAARLRDLLIERVRANVPVRTGALRDSVSGEVTRDGDAVVVTISVGGPRAPYAWAVHERHDPPGVATETTPEGRRGSKFMTRVMDIHRKAVSEAAVGVVKDTLLERARR